MRIIYIGTMVPQTAGAALSCSRIMLGLAARGHDVRTLAPLADEHAPAAADFARRHPEIECEWFPVSEIDMFPYLPPARGDLEREQAMLDGRVRSMLERKPADALLVRELYAWTLPTLARAAGIACVVLVRGNPTAAILRKAYSEPLARRLLRQYRRCGRVVCVARHMELGLRGIGVENCETIRNAIDVEQFRPRPKSAGLLREWRIPQGSFVVLHASQLTPLKRPLDIVEAAAIALPRCERLFFVIIGHGPLRGEMEMQCGRRGLSGRFRFTGTLPYERMPEAFLAADAVVSPSESEGLSRVYLETQACGKTLIASDIPAAREVVDDGVDGLLFTKGDPEHLARQMLRCAHDATVGAAIGAKARARARDYALDIAVDRYLTVLHGIAGAQ